MMLLDNGFSFDTRNLSGWFRRYKRGLVKNDAIDWVAFGSFYGAL